MSKKKKDRNETENPVRPKRKLPHLVRHNSGIIKNPKNMKKRPRLKNRSMSMSNLNVKNRKFSTVGPRFLKRAQTKMKNNLKLSNSKKKPVRKRRGSITSSLVSIWEKKIEKIKEDGKKTDEKLTEAEKEIQEASSNLKKVRKKAIEAGSGKLIIEKLGLQQKLEELEKKKEKIEKNSKIEKNNNNGPSPKEKEVQKEDDDILEQLMIEDEIESTKKEIEKVMWKHRDKKYDGSIEIVETRVKELSRKLEKLKIDNFEEEEEKKKKFELKRRKMAQAGLLEEKKRCRREKERRQFEELNFMKSLKDEHTKFLTHKEIRNRNKFLEQEAEKRVISFMKNKNISLNLIGILSIEKYFQKSIINKILKFRETSEFRNLRFLKISNLPKDCCDDLGLFLSTRKLSLEEIDLSNSGLDDSKFEMISKGILISISKSRIKKIDISENNITQNSGSYVCSILEKAPLLRDFNINNNPNFGTVGFEKLLKGILRNKNSKIRVLENFKNIGISYSNLGTNNDDTSGISNTNESPINSLSSVFGNRKYFNHKITKIVFSYNNLTGPCDNLSLILSNFQNLRTLDFSNSSITDESLSSILPGIEKLPRLKNLNLHNSNTSFFTVSEEYSEKEDDKNSDGKNGKYYINKKVEKNNKFENKLTLDSISLLEESLLKSKSKYKVTLEGNKFEDSSIIEDILCSQVYQNLENLDFSNMFLEDSSVDFLKEIIEESMNNQLGYKSLNLSNNKFENSSGAFKNMFSVLLNLETSKSLRSLDLSRNQFLFSTKKKLEEFVSCFSKNLGIQEFSFFNTGLNDHFTSSMEKLWNVLFYRYKNSTSNRKLRKLNLGGNRKFSNFGVIQFLENANFENIEISNFQLILDGLTGIQTTAVSKLTKFWKKCSEIHVSRILKSKKKNMNNTRILGNCVFSFCEISQLDDFLINPLLSELHALECLETIYLFHNHVNMMSFKSVAKSILEFKKKYPNSEEYPKTIVWNAKEFQKKYTEEKGMNLEKFGYFENFEFLYDHDELDSELVEMAKKIDNENVEKWLCLPTVLQIELRKRIYTSKMKKN